MTLNKGRFELAAEGVSWLIKRRGCAFLISIYKHPKSRRKHVHVQQCSICRSNSSVQVASFMLELRLSVCLCGGPSPSKKMSRWRLQLAAGRTLLQKEYWELSWNEILSQEQQRKKCYCIHVDCYFLRKNSLFFCDQKLKAESSPGKHGS